MTASREELERWMERAVELARRGRGHVEPNPQVGCLLVRDGDVVAEGWHARFGGPHAERVALEQAGEQARGATCIVTLEPCCHFGKTPPCTDALIAAGVAHVVIGCLDPSPTMSGNGVRALEAAGIGVTTGVLEPVCRALIAPFAKGVRCGRPWIHAKWAMTADGRLATELRDSQWISGDDARAIVHTLRGVSDGIVVGIETALADDPQLTARPPGPRTPVRIVLYRQARLPLDSQLVRSAHDVPLLVAAGGDAPQEAVDALRRAGADVWIGPPSAPSSTWLADLLNELGRRGMQHVLVEGGARVLGAFFELREIDEVHVFVAPKLVGGRTAPLPVPLLGAGVEQMKHAVKIQEPTWRVVGDDVYLHGRITWPE